MTCGSIEEKSKELKDLLETIDTTGYNRDKIMNLIADIYKIGYENGKYAATGPLIDLYGDRQSDR